ncbi:hypothetical protein [Sphingomonas koreensis]
MFFLRRNKHVSSVGPLQDLREALRIRHGYQLWFLLAAFATTGLILTGFYLDSYFERAYKREIIYVQNWRADRTLDEIVAQQKIDEEARQKREAEAKAKAEKKRIEYKKVDDKLKSWGL